MIRVANLELFRRTSLLSFSIMSTWDSFLKATGLASYDNYIEPRLSIGNAVPNREFSTGHFKIQVDSEALALVIRNDAGKILWKCKRFRLP